MNAETQQIPIRSPIPALLRGALIERDQRTCQYCKRSSGNLTHDPDGVTWHIDHVMPVARGGATAEENLRLSCAACNLKKGAAHPDSDWQQRSVVAPKQRSIVQRGRADTFRQEQESLERAEYRKRTALQCLAHLDMLAASGAYLAFRDCDALGSSHFFAIRMGISLESINAGTLPAYRDTSREFEWVFSIEPLYDVLEQKFGLSIAELREEIAACITTGYNKEINSLDCVMPAGAS